MELKDNFYRFSQNNSFGRFEITDKLSEIVIIEAKTYKEANYIAGDIGIYFDGCENGYDCNCCGDRWYMLDEYRPELELTDNDKTFEM